jgi:hypothetical protein
MNARESLSHAVIEAVAAREGVDPAELPEALYDAVDTDALDSLFRAEDGEVVFPYMGYEVRVTSAGVVDLTPLDA